MFLLLLLYISQVHHPQFPLPELVFFRHSCLPMNNTADGLNAYFCSSGYNKKFDEETEAFSDDENEDDGVDLKKKRKDVTQVVNGQLASIKRRLLDKLSLQNEEDVVLVPFNDTIKIIVKSAWNTTEIESIVRKCVMDEYRIGETEVRTFSDYNPDSGQQDNEISVVVSFDTKKFIANYLSASKWPVQLGWAIVIMSLAFGFVYKGLMTLLRYF